MFRSPLDLRWARAQGIDPDDVVIQEVYQPEEGWLEVEGWVRSQSSNGVGLGYNVSLTFIDNRLALASCTCPDFNKEMRGRGIPLLHSTRVCKHILAAGIKVRRQLNLDLLAFTMYLAGFGWQPEFGGGNWVQSSH